MTTKNINQLAKNLFQEINNYLEGEKHYTKKETKENENNFISAIITKDNEYLENYYPMLEDEQIIEIENLLSI